LKILHGSPYLGMNNTEKRRNNFPRLSWQRPIPILK
jgi:hypothetical protein